jgi:chromosome segregation ATPase
LRIKTLEEEKEQEHSQYLQLEAAKEAFTKRLQSLQEEMSNNSNVTQQLEAEKAALNKQLEELTATNNTLKEQLEAMELKYKQLEEKYNTLEATHKEQGKIAEQKERKFAELSEQLLMHKNDLNLSATTVHNFYLLICVDIYFRLITSTKNLKPRNSNCNNSKTNANLLKANRKNLLLLSIHFFH